MSIICGGKGGVQKPLDKRKSVRENRGYRKDRVPSDGVSVSEFARQAIIEKLERLNVVSSEVKTVLAREVAENEQ